MTQWNNAGAVAPRGYDCGYCGHRVGPNLGFAGFAVSGSIEAYVYICSHCTRPTFFDPWNGQTPGATFGAAVDFLPDGVRELYDEARRCMAVSAYTSAALACRKLLMNVAVDRGAEENKKFVQYVDWLANNNYVPPGSHGWVGQIKDTGNEATHEIDLVEREEAEKVISFTEMLLKFVYEFPARAGGASPA